MPDGKRPAVFDSENVVGKAEKGGLQAGEGFQSKASCGGERQAGFLSAAKPLPVFRRGLRFGQKGSGPADGFRVPAFASKAEPVHAAQTVQDRNRPGGEIFRAGAGKPYRKLQNEIRAAGERHARPLVFIQDGRRAALREAAAHDHGHIIGPGQAAGFGKLIFVSFVKRIIFRDDPCDGHGRRSPFCVSFSAVSGFIIA